MTRQQVLDLYFMDARCKLIELAAFLDRPLSQSDTAGEASSSAITMKTVGEGSPIFFVPPAFGLGLAAGSWEPLLKSERRFGSRM